MITNTRWFSLKGSEFGAVSEYLSWRCYTTEKQHSDLDKISGRALRAQHAHGELGNWPSGEANTLRGTVVEPGWQGRKGRATREGSSTNMLRWVGKLCNVSASTNTEEAAGRKVTENAFEAGLTPCWLTVPRPVTRDIGARRCWISMLD